MNSVNLAGRLGADPEIRQTNNGSMVCELRLATDEGRDKTEWHTVIAWNQQAELCQQHLQKGRFITVSGRLQTRSWEQDGQRRYKTEVIAHRVGFGPRQDGGGQRQQRDDRGGRRDYGDGDIPF